MQETTQGSASVARAGRLFFYESDHGQVRLTRTGLALLALLSAFAAVPMFVVELPPLQDLPQHLATVSILRNYPDFALGKYYELALGRTQYLAYYLTAWALSYPLGVLLANKLLFTLALVSLSWSIWSLLRALERDERVALLALPLAHNAHFMLGFLNFLSAIPMGIYGLSLAVRLRRSFSVGRAVALSCVMTLCFYTHVVPFALAGLGAALVLAGDNVTLTVRRWFALVPPALCALFWLTQTAAGESVSAAAKAEQVGELAATRFPLVQDASYFWIFLTDVLRSEWDEWTLFAWFAAVLACMVSGRGPLGSKLSETMTMRVGVLFALCVAAYLVSPAAYDWIWPVSGRFPILAALFLLPLLRVPAGVSGSALLALVCVMYTVNCIEISRCFRWVEQDEVGDFKEAIAAIPAQKRVVGLMLEPKSEYVNFSPFLHYVALYQLAKGGVVMFSFADFPQSPVVLREQNRPPRVPRRWEWRANRVEPSELEYYDYVLVRGISGRMARARLHRLVHRSEHWSVWTPRTPEEKATPAPSDADTTEVADEMENVTVEPGQEPSEAADEPPPPERSRP
jgi:hypothetical protein